MTVVILFILFGITGCGVLYQSGFGKNPKREDLDRMKQSPHYADGKFRNLHDTPQLTGDDGFFRIVMRNFFTKKPGTKPKGEIPAIKTDLLNLNHDEDVLVWVGHSSCFLQIAGKRILIDPVFSKYASPVPFYNRAFKGTNIYKPEDIPEIDYLIITHDHWDHLDYPTVKALKPKIAKIICPLGIGSHFKYWKFDRHQIFEMDWYDHIVPDSGFTVYCFPARHFSGRSLSPNKTLWASFLIQTPEMNIYISGDSGYDTHFAEIGKQFPEIDLAILENGQYDKNWRYIHLMPEEMLQVAQDLHAKYVLPVHSAKFKLANHPWKEPLSKVTGLQNNSTVILTPLIGEKVNLTDSIRPFKQWWVEVE